jgi:hypothetical protein
VELAAQPDLRQSRTLHPGRQHRGIEASEECPSNAAIFAEILDAAGVPAGVFNLVQATAWAPAWR